MRTGGVALVFGTRPELVKLAPLVWQLGDAVHTIHTGQHPIEDLRALCVDLEVSEPNHACSVAPTPAGRQIGEAISAVTDALIEHRPDVVVVQGDTNSTLAGALAASSLDLPVVHVEAGLRAFDRRLPEERNRILVDHLCDLACAPTETARAHLTREGIEGSRIVMSGNTVVDAAARCLADPSARAAMLDARGLDANAFVLATFHRPENVDDGPRLDAIIRELAALELPVVFPVHPRTRDRAAHAGIDLDRGNIRVIPPLGYRKFLALAAECALIVTDSGGVQEEASIVGRPAIVVRRSTERPEVLGTVTTLVEAGPAIGTEAGALLSDRSAVHRRLAGLTTPYGDGHAATRIVAAINDLLDHLG